MRNIIEHQTPPEKDAQLIEKVAAALATLDDFTLEVIGRELHPSEQRGSCGLNKGRKSALNEKRTTPR